MHPLWDYGITTFDLGSGRRVDAGTELFRRITPVLANGHPVAVIDAVREPAASLEALVLQHAWRSDLRGSGPSRSRDIVNDECFVRWREQLAECDFDDRHRPTTCEFLHVDRDPAKKDAYRISGIEAMLTSAGLAIVSNDTSEARRVCRGVMLTIPWGEAESLLKPGVRLR
jgi:hypothetical protein